MRRRFLTDRTTNLWTAATVLASLVIAGLLAIGVGQHRERLEALRLVDATLAELEQVRADADAAALEAAAEREELLARIEELTRQVEELQEQVRELGGTPVTTTATPLDDDAEEVAAVQRDPPTPGGQDAPERPTAPDPSPTPTPPPPAPPAPPPSIPAPPPPELPDDEDAPGQIEQLLDGLLGGVFVNCAQARDLGAAPVHVDDPGYGLHLDADRNGIGCQ